MCTSLDFPYCRLQGFLYDNSDCANFFQYLLLHLSSGGTKRPQFFDLLITLKKAFSLIIHDCVAISLDTPLPLNREGACPDYVASHRHTSRQ